MRLTKDICWVNVNWGDMMYHYETHLHTQPASGCAKWSAAEAVKYFKDAGYAGIFITNHFLDDDIPEIPCDPKRMRQVFLNILDNAAKHGGEGKRIVASMTYEEENVVVRIRDFGPGIPEEELPHVKKKFYKGNTKVRGTGIGLAVCDEIVEMHGGTLDITNAPGGGTMVTVSLPSAQ